MLACLLPGAAAAETAPPGANDWSCRPSASHPNPVVLVHGLGANMSANWSALSPVLARSGYCVFALTYGRDESLPPPFDQFGGVVPMEESAQQLAGFVDSVLAATGAMEVDIVGHSEGSLMPNYYVKFLGGAAKVARYVALTPLWRGTNFAGAGTLFALGKPSGSSEQFAEFVAQFCGSCPQFVAGSAFLEKLSAGGVAVAGVTYTNLVTRYDLLVLPYTSGFMYAPNATNIVVQDQCRTDFSEHAWLAFDPVAHQDVLNALDPAHPRPVPCPIVLPGLGGIG